MSKPRAVKKTGAAALAVLLGLGIASQGEDQLDGREAASPSVTAAATPTPAEVEPVADATPGATTDETGAPIPPATVAPSQPAPTSAGTTAPLLFAAAGGDGDSWKDRAGREYRLGLVNAPETGECFGAQATDRRKALVRRGFRARTYATDRFGRSVSLVALADGRNLNVLLAREGLVDDRYLAEFRHEYEALATQLDVAFADAKRARRGLWGGCPQESAPQGFAAPPAQPAGDCHPDYATCIPVKGDGSGRGEANDLDCGDLRKLVRIRQVGVDPYRLDGDDDDGLGCESYA